MLRNRHDTYGLVAAILHWLVVLVVVGLFGLGLWMVEPPWARRRTAS